MGFSVSVYAIFDCDPAEIHHKLKLEPTGEFVEFPDSPIAAAHTQAGSYILYIDDRRIFGEDLIRALVPNTKFLSCNVNETVMYSAASLMENGREQWSVIHDSSYGLRHLDSSEKMPEEYYSIRKEKLSAQDIERDKVDHIFDIPVDLFVSLGGVRYDEYIDSANEQPWQTLERIPSNRWWWPFSGK